MEISQHTAFKIFTLALLIAFTGCKGSKELSTEAVEGKGDDIQFQRRFFAAQTQKSIGNSEKAYILFQEALTFEPQNDAVLYELARLELEKNDLEKSVVYLEQAIEIDGTNHWYHMLMADVQFNLGQLDKAEKSYNRVIELNPDEYASYFDLASVHLYQNEVKEALDVYNRLEKRVGVNEDLALQKYDLYISNNDLENAELEILKLIESQPQEIRYYAILSQFYNQTSQAEKALAVYETMETIDPNNGILQLELSEYHAAHGNDEKSFEALRKAFKTEDISIDQKIGILLRFYSLTEVNLNMLPQAFELLEITALVHPDEAKSFAIFGDFLIRENQLSEARNKFRKAVELDPSKSIIWSQILEIDSQLSDFESMQLESQEAIELFPVSPEFYLYNGLAHFQKKAYQKAIESLNMGKDLVIENDLVASQFYSALGDAHHSLGDDQKSDESYDQALAFNPNNVFVLNNYAFYLSLRQQKLEKAAAMAKKANTLQPGQVSFQDTYGWVLYQQEKYSEAKEWLQKAVENGGSGSGEVLEHYGDALFQLNLKEEAIIQWKAAQKAGGGSSLLQKKIEDRKLYE